LSEAASQSEKLKMAAFGCGANEYTKTEVTLNVSQKFKWFTKQGDQLPGF
jgi:hypothetical protein